MASRIRTKEENHISRKMSLRIVKQGWEMIYVVKTGNIFSTVGAYYH
jgi:hypothetical protein